MARYVLDETPDVRSEMLQVLAEQVISLQKRRNALAIRLAESEQRPGTAISEKIESSDDLLDQLKSRILGGSGELLTPEAHAELIAKANARIENEFNATNEIELDDEPVTSEGDNGTWVAAWIWVPAAKD